MHGVLLLLSARAVEAVHEGGMLVVSFTKM